MIRMGKSKRKEVVEERRKRAREMFAQGRTVGQIARSLGVSRATVYRYLSDYVEEGPTERQKERIRELWAQVFGKGQELPEEVWDRISRKQAGVIMGYLLYLRGMRRVYERLAHMVGKRPIPRVIYDPILHEYVQENARLRASLSKLKEENALLKATLRKLTQEEEEYERYT